MMKIILEMSLIQSRSKRLKNVKKVKMRSYQNLLISILMKLILQVTLNRLRKHLKI